jgi:hypothetical protein
MEVQEPNESPTSTPNVPEPKTTFTFTKEELEAHDSNVQEEAYRKAAISTINNLVALDEYPISKAMKKLSKYANYLVKMYKLEVK